MRKTRLSRPAVQLHIDNLVVQGELYIHAAPGRVHQYIVLVGKSQDQIAEQIKAIEDKRGGVSEYRPGKTYLRVKTPLREGERRVYGGGKDGFTRSVNNRHLTSSSDRPNIFTIYEQNIGPLTPMLGDQLKDIDATYPQSWFIDAVSIAVENNKRNLRYILAILRRWQVEGKDSGRKNGKTTDKTALRYEAVRALAGTNYTEADIEEMIKALQGVA
ncbi:MAG: DnaD domain protein [Anaerolineae bacterium]|nr:DnaD domain protein [Anaerolineae bacterium]